jgi:hypothetical protein
MIHHCLINTQPCLAKFLSSFRIKQKGRIIMPYCTKCGALLKSDDKFCSVCGTPVSRIFQEEYSVSSNNLIQRVKELLHEGNVTRIIVRDDKGSTLLEIPATAGVIGAVLVPWLAALGVIAALATNCKIVVEKRVPVSV